MRKTIVHKQTAVTMDTIRRKALIFDGFFSYGCHDLKNKCTQQDYLAAERRLLRTFLIGA